MRYKKISLCYIFLFVGLSTHFSIAEQADLVHFPDPVITDQNMSVIIRSLRGVEISMGSELGCITPSGYIAGAIVLDETDDGQWGMAIFGDDVDSDEIDGFHNGERLLFLYWDAEHDWELNLSLDLIEGEDVFNNFGFLIIDITVSVPTEENLLPVNFGLNVLFPNPFNSSLKINYSLPIAGYTEVNIYNLSGGREFTLFSGLQSRGEFHLDFSNRILPSGNYYIVLKQNKLISIRNVVLLK